MITFTRHLSYRDGGITQTNFVRKSSSLPTAVEEQTCQLAALADLVERMAGEHDDELSNFAAMAERGERKRETGKPSGRGGGGGERFSQGYGSSGDAGCDGEGRRIDRRLDRRRERKDQ